MDKLKQVLKYQFWILLGIALILPVVGWAMARSGLVKETEDRKKTLTDLTGKLTAGPEDPNADWEKGLQDINRVQKSQVREAWLALYEHQQQFKTWPKYVIDDPTKLQPEHLEQYRVTYADEIEKVRQIVQPLDEEGNGIVDLDDSLMPHPEYDWAQENRAPTPKEVEGAQEDVWLLAGILKSIKEINANATTQLDAPIRQIQQLYLRGGSENSAAGGAEGGDPMGAMGAADMAMPRGMMPGMMGRGMGSMMGSGADAGGVSFNPDDEMGVEVPEPAEPAAGESEGGGVGAADDIAAMGGGMGGRGGMMGMMGMMGGGLGASKMVRYVQDKPEWRTRGFYLEVVMDHRKVPDLLVALANSDWPIRVTRVHQADTMDEELVSEDAGGMAGRGGMAGAMGIDIMGTRGAGGPTRGGMRSMGGSKAVGMPGLGGGAGDPRSMAGRGAKRSVADDEAGTGGGGPRGRGMMGSMLGGSGARGGMEGSASALDDHMLATVAIDGLITIFKKPPEEVEEAPAGSQGVPETTTDGQEPRSAEAEEPSATEAMRDDTSDVSTQETPTAESPAAESPAAETPDAAEAETDAEKEAEADGSKVRDPNAEDASPPEEKRVPAEGDGT